MKIINRKLKIHRELGFSIIELLVAMAILMILSSIFIVNLNSANRRLDLNLAVQYLVSNIRLMQTKSLAPDPLSASGVYGLFFTLDNKNEYILFEDKSNPPNDAYDGGSELIDKIKLPQGISFDGFKTNLGDTHTATVVFKAPIPTVKINQSQSISYLLLKVTKSTAGSSLSKEVMIETSNNIEIQ